MKNIKILLMLLVVIGMSACSKAGDKDIAMGRYVEETVSLPDEVFDNLEISISVLVNPEGRLELYTRSTTINRYVQNEDGSWTRNTPDWGNSEFRDTTLIRYGDNGKLYAVARIPDILMPVLYELHEDGTKDKVNMEGWDQKGENGWYPYILDLAIMENEDILVKEAWSKKIIQYDFNGKKLADYDYETDTGIDGAGTDIITINKAFNKVIVLDQDTGLSKYEIEVSKDSYSCILNGIRTGGYGSEFPNIALCSDGGDNIYIACPGGIYHYDKGGSVLQTLVNGSQSALNLSYYQIMQISKSPDNSFYVFLSADVGTDFQIMHYVYKPDIPTVPNKKLKIYSLEENELIKEAIVKFQEKHPEVAVNYCIAKKDGSTLSTEDYIKVLNSEILANDGADIILCDGLPEQNYVKNGLFTDISDIIEPLVQKDELYNNIVDCYRQDGSIYTLPMKFQAGTYIGKTEAIDAAASLDSLQNFYKSNPGTPLLGECLSYKQLFGWFYGIYSDQLMDSNGIPDKEKLISFLDQLKSINTFDNKREEDADWFEATCFLDFAQDKSQLIMGKISNVDTLLYSLQAKGRNNKMISAGNIFIPRTVAGINRKSNEIGIAKEFLQVMLSEEIQQRDRELGIPINKKAVAHWCGKELHYFSAIWDKDTSYTISCSPPAARKQVEELTNMINQLTTPVRYDTTIYNIIYNEIDPFFLGEKSAKEVSDIIMQKISLYKKE